MDQTIPEWATIQKTYRKCPHCKNGHLDTRIRRSQLVKNLFFFIDFKRYECSNCGHKAYIISK